MNVELELITESMEDCPIDPLNHWTINHIKKDGYKASLVWANVLSSYIDVSNSTITIWEKKLLLVESAEGFKLFRIIL